MFFRVVVTLPSDIPTVLPIDHPSIEELTQMSDMKKIIDEDINKLITGQVGCQPKIIDWNNKGSFLRLTDCKEVVYIYAHSNYMSASSVYYSEIEKICSPDFVLDPDLAICLEDHHHDYLEPYMMSNKSL